MAKQALRELLAQRRALFPWKEHEPLEDWAEDTEDEKEGTDRIERISLELCCRAETPEAQSDGREPAFRERICIDRAAGVLQQEQTMGEAGILHTYRAPAGVEAVLDLLDRRDLQPGGPVPSDLAETFGRRWEYVLWIEFQHHPACKFTGCFDRYGLPPFYQWLAEGIEAFLEMYELGGALEPSLYQSARRRKSDLIFCRVAFQAFGRTYYYLTTDDSIRAGDRVIVPVGNSREEKRGIVTEVAYYQPENAPYPPEKTKTILRKLPERPPAF